MSEQKLPRRAEVDASVKWRLEDIYADDGKWEQDLANLEKYIETLSSYRGRIQTASSLLGCLKQMEILGETMERLYGYAQMRKDEDNTNSRYQGYADRAASAYVKVEQAAAFVQPEILSCSEATIQNWIHEEPELEEFRHYLEDIMRQKPHTLPAEQEELLAGASEMAQAPGLIFGMFNDADLTFPRVRGEDGELTELTHGRYIQFLESSCRQVREDAFKTMHNTYDQWKNTLASTLNSAVKQSAFFARSKRYASSRTMSLDANNIPEEVYDNLIAVVHNHLPSLHRYMAIRADLLDLPHLHMWDLHVPMVADMDLDIDYREAKDMVVRGLQPLGSAYCRDLQNGLDSGWVDWFENRGKTSGAYSWGAYGVHPFVLMNYQNNVDNMFTLAHEMGHAMHSYYSQANQRYINAGYSIFVAEVASTVNECLVMNQLLKETRDPGRRMYLLNHYLNQFRGTVFRQTMFAEFERDIHGQVERGEPMTAESLHEQYHQLNGRYHGQAVENDREAAAEWSRIPHFYRPFYVYQYATGFSAAVALAEAILEEGQPALDRYLGFLKAGGSDYPMEVLRQAGVDMRTPEPIAQALRVFSQLLDEMEALAKGQ